jgi:serine/threonine protein phosphatase PrpC
MGATPSASRLIDRQQLKPERKNNEPWVMEKARASCIQNAVGLGMDSKTLEEMLDRRAQLAQADFCKERIYQFMGNKGQGDGVNCLALYGLYSGFKFQTRKVCQDRVLIKEIHLKNGTSYLMLGIFDGHGTTGEHCSGFVVNNIYKYMEQYLNKYGDNIHKALVKTFAKTDRMLQKFSRSNQDCNVLLSGTTATVVLVPSKGFEKISKIHVAHVGDSKAVISSANAESRKNFGVWDLTFDHNFEDPYESQRAVAKGGVVERIVINGQPQGPLRVFHPSNRVRPGLAVSRSFGDVEAHRVGVSSDPDVLHLELLEHEDVIMLASDGIWDMLSGSNILDHLDRNGWNVSSFEKLILECARRWIYTRTGVCDDLSIIVFRLNHSTSTKSANQTKPASEPTAIQESKSAASDHLAPIKEEISSSPSQSDIPKPSFNSQELFNIIDEKIELLAESPTQTVTDEQKIEKAALRRSTLKNIAEIVVDEFKMNEHEIDEDALAALETNSLPAFDKAYMNELDVEFSQNSVNTEASSLRSDQYLTNKISVERESREPSEMR